MHRLHTAHLDTPGLTPSSSPGTDLVLRGADARHARRVRRARAGEGVEIIDGRGTVWRGVVTGADGLGRDELSVRLDAVSSTPQPDPLEIAACAPKGGRLGDMVDMLAQVGATRWIPVVSDRSGDPERLRIDKLRRVAREAAKQCGRAWDLGIDEPATFADALVGADDLWVAHPGGAPAHTRTRPPGAGRVCRVLVGPEGGWSDAELAMMDGAGAIRLGLGAHVLRIETAAVVAAATLRVWIDGAGGEPAVL